MREKHSQIFHAAPKKYVSRSHCATQKRVPQFTGKVVAEPFLQNTLPVLPPPGVHGPPRGSGTNEACPQRGRSWSCKPTASAPHPLRIAARSGRTRRTWVRRCGAGRGGGEEKGGCGPQWLPRSALRKSTQVRARKSSRSHQLTKGSRAAPSPAQRPPPRAGTTWPGV